MSGFGSNADWEGPDRRLMGTALSARLSTKSRTIKSLLEKLSRVKLGPLGKRLLGPELEDRSMMGDLGAAEATRFGRYICVEDSDSESHYPYASIETRCRELVVASLEWRLPRAQARHVQKLPKQAGSRVA